jgi:hypothetical protein
MNRIIKYLVLSLFIISILGFDKVSSATPMMTLTNPNYNSFSGGSTDITWGYSFSVSAPIIVTALGHIKAVNFPLNAGKQVGLWSSTGVLLASTTVTTSDPVISNYAFKTLASSINLSAGTYVLGSLMLAGENIPNISTPAQLASFPIDSNFTLINGRNNFSAGGGFGYPSTTNSTYYLTGNLLFDAVPTPEPSTYLVLGSTLLLALAGVTYRKKAIKREA